MAVRDSEITQALNIVGIERTTWDDTPEEKRGALFKEFMDKKLPRLQSALEDETFKIAIQRDIDLLKKVSDDHPFVNQNKDASKSEPEPIKEKKKKPDLNGKTWADIMNEMSELPSKEALEEYWDARKKMVERLDQTLEKIKLYKDIKNVLNRTPKQVQEILSARRELTKDAEEKFKDNKEGLKKWRAENGPAAHKVEDPVHELEKIRQKEHALETYRQEKLIEEEMTLTNEEKKEKKKELHKKEAEEIAKGMSPTQRTELHLKEEETAKVAEEKAKNQSLNDATKTLNDATKALDNCKKAVGFAQNKVNEVSDKIKSTTSTLEQQQKKTIMMQNKYNNTLNRFKTASENVVTKKNNVTEKNNAVENSAADVIGSIKKEKDAKKEMKLAKDGYISAKKAVSDNVGSTALKAECDKAEIRFNNAAKSLEDIAKNNKNKKLSVLAKAKAELTEATTDLSIAEINKNSAEKKMERIKAQNEEASKAESSTKAELTRMEEELKTADATLRETELKQKQQEQKVSEAQEKLNLLKNPGMTANATLDNKQAPQQIPVPQSPAGNTSTLPAASSSPVPTPQQQIKKNNETQETIEEEVAKKEKTVQQVINISSEENGVDPDTGNTPMSSLPNTTQQPKDVIKNVIATRREEEERLQKAQAEQDKKRKDDAQAAEKTEGTNNDPENKTKKTLRPNELG